MTTNLRRIISIVALGLGLSAAANATLINRGNGMIYDSDQNLTWLQDANYAKTSGYDADGAMNWNDAMAWAEGLSYGGYNDWRLPTITDTGLPGCSSIGYNGTDCGFNVDTAYSELAYMYYNNLGNVGWYDTHGNETVGCTNRSSAPFCLTYTSADGVDILNLQAWYYWSSSEYAGQDFTPGTVSWAFDPGQGIQHLGSKTYSEYFAWVVRDGDVAAPTASVPEPGTLLLLAAGLAGVASSRRRRH